MIEERRSLQTMYKDLGASIDELIDLMERSEDPFEKPMWRAKLLSHYQMMYRMVEQLIAFHERYE